MLSILKIGLPTAIGGSTMQFGFLLMTKNVNAYGTTATTAYGIGNKINSIITMPANGIGSAISTIVGQNFGAGNIKRTLKLVTITICTSRPGIIIGKGGQDVDKLKEELKKLTDKDVQINIYEVKRPELDAHIVANNIAHQIEGKVAYRRAVKMAVASTMRLGAEGIKVLVSGRLNGAEMARAEMFKEGRTPLHTLRADIDYALVPALTKVGLIGVKVWICRGEVYGKKDLAPNFTNNGNERRGGNGGRRGGFRNKKNNR